MNTALQADMVRPDSKHDTQTMLDARAKITAQLKKWVTEVTAEKQKQLHQIHIKESVDVVR